MRLFHRLLRVVTWLTVLTLVPVPWGAFEGVRPSEWRPLAALVAWAEENGIPPSERRGVGQVPVGQNAFPPDDVVMQPRGSMDPAA